MDVLKNMHSRNFGGEGGGVNLEESIFDWVFLNVGLPKYRSMGVWDGCSLPCVSRLSQQVPTPLVLTESNIDLIMSHGDQEWPGIRII